MRTDTTDDRDMAYGPVQVEVVTPLPSIEHPVRLGSARSYELGTDPVQLLNEHPKRQRALIIASAAIRIGQSAEETRTGYGAEWPPTITLELTHTDRMWVAAETGTATVSVIEEYWT